jgi:predicted dehydrogenase
MADIGTHAFHLARFVTQLVPEELSCRLMKLHPSYGMDDYGCAMVRFANDALATITVSQVTHGRLNDLSIEVDGTDGSLSWRQEEPNQLVVRRFGQATETLERNPHAPYMSAAGSEACRLPAGHPEAFFEAFANIYRDFIADVRRQQEGHLVDVRETKYPNVYDGLEGVHFIQQCVNSNREKGAWLTLRHAELHGEA